MQQMTPEAQENALVVILATVKRVAVGGLLLGLALGVFLGVVLGYFVF